MQKVTIKTNINASLDKVWELYTVPDHVVNWNNASEDWHTPHAENDLRVGGRFLYRMEAKDGSAGFNFSGVYEQVEPNKLIVYSMDDERMVEVVFTEETESVNVQVTFDAEDTVSVEMQQTGWQSILDNFKKYVEDAAN